MFWNPYLLIALISFTLLAIISMILAITVSPYFWISFVIFFILLSPIIYLWIKSKWKGSSGGYSSSSGSESSLDAY